MKRDMRLIPQNKEASDLLTCIVGMKGADVLDYFLFKVMFERGEIAMASRWTAQ